MEMEKGKLPPPPGLITTLVRGFDSVASHVLVILPPLLSTCSFGLARICV
jgi:hypothetical protein